MFVKVKYFFVGHKKDFVKLEIVKYKIIWRMPNQDGMKKYVFKIMLQ